MQDASLWRSAGYALAEAPEMKPGLRGASHAPYDDQHGPARPALAAAFAGRPDELPFWGVGCQHSLAGLERVPVVWHFASAGLTDHLKHHLAQGHSQFWTGHAPHLPVGGAMKLRVDESLAGRRDSAATGSSTLFPSAAIAGLPAPAPRLDTSLPSWLT